MVFRVLLFVAQQKVIAIIVTALRGEIVRVIAKIGDHALWKVLRANQTALIEVLAQLPNQSPAWILCLVVIQEVDSGPLASGQQRYGRRTRLPPPRATKAVRVSTDVENVQVNIMQCPKKIARCRVRVQRACIWTKTVVKWQEIAAVETIWTADHAQALVVLGQQRHGHQAHLHGTIHTLQRVLAEMLVLRTSIHGLGTRDMKVAR